MPLTTCFRNFSCTTSFLPDSKDSGYNLDILSTIHSNAFFSPFFSSLNCAMRSDVTSSDTYSFFVQGENMFENRSSFCSQLGSLIAKWVSKNVKVVSRSVKRNMRVIFKEDISYVSHSIRNIFRCSTQCSLCSPENWSSLGYDEQNCLLVLLLSATCQCFILASFFVLVVLTLIYLHIAVFLEAMVRSVYCKWQPLSADKCFDFVLLSSSLGFGGVLFVLVLYGWSESAFAGSF